MPAVLSANVSKAPPPLVQVGLSLVVCLGATVAITAWLERAPSGEEDAPATGAAVDLGIGADRWARTSDASYRTSGRPEVLVRGSTERATAAFDECARGRHRSLVVAACTLSAVSVSFALRLSVFL